MNSVMFVCTANMCRSPMAMALLRGKVAAEKPDDANNWVIESCGTWTRKGDPAALRVEPALRPFGVSVSGHRSQMADRKLLSRFNLILTMEQGQKEALRVEFPELSKRIYMLSEMIDSRFDIQDPMGGPLNEFEATAQELADIINRGFDRIQRLARDPE